MPLCLTFISLKKAFDSLGLEAVVEAFDNQGVLTQYLRHFWSCTCRHWVAFGHCLAPYTPSVDGSVTSQLTRCVLLSGGEPWTTAWYKYRQNYSLCCLLLSTFSIGSTILACQEEFFSLSTFFYNVVLLSTVYSGNNSVHNVWITCRTFLRIFIAYSFFF
ncbi:hypothetical protein RB195_024000 [Necator americanus]|uniref:Reverse transcriptase domain-containing protein n=1 Tax=Necator americanus TaxID=51031 RepID=A0ABR1ELI7_NECAM